MMDTINTTLYIDELGENVELTVFYNAPRGEEIIIHESLGESGEEMDIYMTSEEVDELTVKVEKQLEDNRRELGELEL